ncbi:hypothetical protein H5071_17460 [Shewanella sp. SR41-2]|nr:hypothetical protein [Shewanella sp. SR41-2]
MMPIHNGTFDLALHDWFEPFERINQLAKQQNVTLLTPKFGQAVMLANPQASELWWRAIILEPQNTDELNQVVINSN